MKAVRLIEIGQPLQLREIPVPAVGEEEVLVRIKAAGICHSDVHYRTGVSSVGPLPHTLGHEIAGVVEEIGGSVTSVKAGDRVCLHYLITCGNCDYCRTAKEQFCQAATMLGKDRDGGYTEFIVVPARNAFPLPDEIPFEHGAVLMCSSATVFHALHKAALKPGERVAVFGAGGLGMSAIQLAKAFGAVTVYAVDINSQKLSLAAEYGAIPVDASSVDPVAKLHRSTGGKGVDVALELVGLPQVSRQAVQSLGVFGRAVLVGITDQLFSVDSYREVLGKEAQIIGSSDHLLQELPVLIEFVRQGTLDLSRVVTQSVPLEASAINNTLNALEEFGGAVRSRRSRSVTSWSCS